MDNVLMRFCRIAHGLSKEQAARKAGMTLEEYKHLETGSLHLSMKHALRLAWLYKTKPSFFLESADQLETLQARAKIIEILKSDNARLNELMTEGYEFIRDNTQHAAEQFN